MSGSTISRRTRLTHRHGLVLTALLWLPLAQAQPAPQPLPPRDEWKASSSSTANPAMAPAMGIDGNPKSYWGGPFSAGHWYQVDLGRTSPVGGVLIQWEGGFATHYLIRYSNDGRQWQDAVRVTGGKGGIEYVMFPAVRARYLRLVAPDRTADWGVSVGEFEPVAQAPRLRGVMGADDTDALWIGGAARVLDKRRPLDIELPRPLPLAGLEVTWKTPPGRARLEARGADGRWTLLAEEPVVEGASSFLAAPEVHEATALRLVTEGGDGAIVDRLELLGPKRLMTPLRRYEIAASRRHRDLFPSSLHQQQVYWTAVGIPAGRQKSVFDEYGNLEAFKGAPLVQPVWRDRDGRAAAAFNAELRHSLREGWMPMPAVEWSPQPGLSLRSEAIAVERDGAPVTLVRYRLRNTGDQPVDGQLALLTRPMQISPPWQNGGLSPLHDIAVENGAVRVNGRRLFQALTPPSAAGVAAFGPHGEGEITRHAADGDVPARHTVEDPDGLAAAIQQYPVKLRPGEHRDVVIAFALGNARIDTQARQWTDAPALDTATLTPGGDAGAAFDALADALAQQWQSRLGRIGLSLPDASLVDMLRAQAAYMLINQSGHAMQPGPRNYNRSFIRDGAATAAILLRMGMSETARDYLHWYAGHAVHPNGLVSPILNDDGSVNTGFGSDLEHDSQGQFIWLVAEIARLDGGAASVRDYQDEVKRALRFLQELRERTIVPGYQAGREAPERFHGIIAPSISHEGYPVPTHSYWDDYWALKGWHDGAWLAEQWGDRETAAWARAQYAALRDSMSASMRATMKWKGIDYIPASADLGDSDPTSVSIGLDPTGQQDLMPADALARTFARYLADVRKRTPDALYAYTPYEMRNVLTYVHLGQPAEANELLRDLVRHRRPAEWQVIAEVVYSDLRHAIYLGDMPHTWIGAEYARSIFGMLMYEADDHLSLLPGTPPEWVAGDGLSIDGLPTAHGTLKLRARRQGDQLRVSLGEGLRADVPVTVAWPGRAAPKQVTVDGRQVRDFDAKGVRLARPFKELVAQW